MPLIDPATPDGFFHMRLVPYADAAREAGLGFFAPGPDVEAESYFEPPRAGSPGPQMVCDATLLSAAGVITRLAEAWADESGVLGDLASDLEALRQTIVSDASPEKDPELTDFVYPLF